MRFDIDLYADNLMLPEEELRVKRVDEQVIRRIVRLRDIYNFMLRNPLKKDREYIDYIQATYKDEKGKPLSKRKAYEDIEILHAVIGNLQQCTKEWHRWRFNNMIMEGYAIAVRHEDAVAIARLAQQYGKYNQLDKNDDHDIGYSELPHIVFGFDVSVMGFQPIPNVYALMEKLYTEFSQSRFANIVEDADAVEIANEPDNRKLPANADTRAISE